VNWIQSVLDWFSATVTDVQDVHRALSECEQNAIDVWWMTIEQMTYFNGKKRALGSKRAPVRKFREGGNRLL